MKSALKNEKMNRKILRKDNKNKNAADEKISKIAWKKFIKECWKILKKNFAIFVNKLEIDKNV